MLLAMARSDMSPLKSISPESRTEKASSTASGQHQGKINAYSLRAKSPKASIASSSIRSAADDIAAPIPTKEGMIFFAFMTPGALCSLCEGSLDWR